MSTTPDRYPDLARQLRDLKGRVAELERGTPTRVAAAGFLTPAITRVSFFDAGPGDQPLPNSTTIQVSFDTVDTDTVGAWNPATPNVLTFMRSGLYLVVGSVVIEGSGSGDRQAFIQGADAAGSTTIPAPVAANAALTPAVFVDADEGETVQLRAWQSSGSALNLTSARLSIAWLGVGSAYGA